MRVENHLDAVKDLKSKLEGKREKLFNADHQLKKYASNEHQHWVRPLVKAMIYSKKHRSIQIRLLSLRTIFRRNFHVLPRELMNLSQRKSGGRKRISVWPERENNSVWLGGHPIYC